MLDRRLIIEHTDTVLDSLSRRHAGEDSTHAVKRLVEMESSRKAVTTETDELRAKRNALSKQIGPLMQQGKRDEAEPLKAEVKAFGARLAELEDQLKALEAEQQALLLTDDARRYHDLGFQVDHFHLASRQPHTRLSRPPCCRLPPFFFW